MAFLNENGIKNLWLHKKNINVTNETINPNDFLFDMLYKGASKCYLEWEECVEYSEGTFVLYNNVLYKVVKEHTSQSDSTPDVADTMFVKFIDFNNHEIYKQ